MTQASPSSTQHHRTIFALALALYGLVGGIIPADAQSGYQTINGTQVYTVIDQRAGVATFSNDCGSQTLTQGQLQAGAIPNNIIPCPRPGGSRSTAPTGPSPAELRRVANCNAGIKANNEGTAKLASDDLGEAIALYQRAQGLVSACNDSKTVALINNNLAEARSRYAACCANDNRVDDARGRFGKDNFFEGDNPFATASGASGTLAGTIFPADIRSPAAIPVARPLPPGMKIAPDSLAREATRICSQVVMERRRCLLLEEARLILERDPDIKALCGVRREGVDRSNCALEAYANQVAAAQAAITDRTNCWFDKNGDPCVGGKVQAPQIGAPAKSLRDEIRERIKNGRLAKGDNTPVSDAEVDAAVKEEQQKQTSSQVAETVPRQSDPDDPLRDFLASGGKSSGGTNTGDLGAPGRDNVLDTEVGSYLKRFGVDPGSGMLPGQATGPTIFDQVHKQYRNQEAGGNIGR